MTQIRTDLAEIKQAIRSIPDFPKAGILFKDITPLLADARLFAGSIDLLTANFKPGSVDAVVGIDARGFIFAAAAALKLPDLFLAENHPLLGPALIGAACAAIAAYLSIKFLMKYFRTNNITPFAVYCFSAGVICSIILFFR